MTDEKLDRVRKVLQRNRLWYPPDGIVAVDEGRGTYHPLDVTRVYPVRDAMRANIQRAIATVDAGEDDPNYVEALNRLAGEDLQLTHEEAKKPKPKKRGRK